MNQNVKDSLLLLKKYCTAFGLKPTADKDVLRPWEPIRGHAIIAGAFVENDMPPVIWVSAKGELWIEQDEDLLQPDEAAVAPFEETLIEVAINNNKRIHVVMES